MKLRTHVESLNNAPANEYMSMAQAELRRDVHGKSDWSVQELFVIREISKAIGKSVDPNYAIRSMLQLLSEFLGLNRGRVFLYEPASRLLKLRVSYGLTDREVSRGVFAPSEGITGRVFQSGETAIIQDIDAEPNYLARTVDRETLPKGTISLLALPIILDGHVRGVLAINRFRNIHRPLSQDLGTLRIVVTQIEHILRIEQLVKDQVERRTAALTIENRELKLALGKHTQHTGIIGSSPAAQDALKKIMQVARTVATVLLLGESGTGKEMFARALHMASDRRERPFIKVNCGAIPDTLFESELFGHEKGAFTGASVSKSGLFEEADGGTLFLDEVGDLPLLMQVKLLRVLQEQKIQRIGSNREIGVNVRIVAATNKDLQQLVVAGRFRLDLFYRLNVVPVKLPPLRSRSTDIPVLCNHFLDKANLKFQREVRLPDKVLDALTGFSWPGNIRQLQNVIERLVLLADGPYVDTAVVTEMLASEHSIEASISSLSEKPVPKRTSMPINSEQKSNIIAALSQSSGNKSKAAQMLGLTLRQLNYRIQILNI